MTTQNKRSAEQRFGGGWSWKLADGRKLDIGEAIQGEGPGEGFAMLPWALDHYERVLRLRPGEAWLLKRMLVHAWEFRGMVYLSQRKITYEANVSRPTLRKWMNRLKELGYVRVVSEGSGMDRRKRYDVSGLHAALALCIAADSSSKWAQANGGALPPEEVRGREYQVQGQRISFCLGFDALQRLVRRGTPGDDGDDD